MTNVPYATTEGHVTHYNSCRNTYYHAHQTLQATKHKTMMLCEIIHGIYPVDGWPDCWIPAVAITGKLKVMNKILWRQWINSLCNCWKVGVCSNYITDTPRPAILRTKQSFTTMYVSLWNNLSPQVNCCNLPCTPPSMPISAKMQQVPSKHSYITLHWFQCLYYWQVIRSKLFSDYCLGEMVLKTRIYNVSRFLGITANY
jgi:hypothetical protein